jgi:hypothetical protein
MATGSLFVNLLAHFYANSHALTSDIVIRLLMRTYRVANICTLLEKDKLVTINFDLSKLNFKHLLHYR